MFDGTEAAVGSASTELDALILIDDIWLFARNAGNAIDRAVAGAERAFLALLWIDDVVG